MSELSALVKALLKQRMYHGTAGVDPKAMIEPRAPSAYADIGEKNVPAIYLTPDQMAAHSYASMAVNRAKKQNIELPFGQSVRAYEVDLQNPLDITDTIKKFQRKKMTFGDAKRAALQQLDTSVHDGFIFRGDGMNPPEVAVFDGTKLRPVQK